MSRCLDALFAIGAQLFTNPLFDAIYQDLDALLPEKPNPPPGSVYSIYSGDGNTIYTMKDGKLNPVQAMAVCNGIVSAVGSLTEVQSSIPSSGTVQKYDIGAGSIVPGFVEPHLHVVLSSLLEGFFVNCDPLACGGNFSDIAAALKTATSDLKGLDWLLGYGYDPSRMPLMNGQFDDLTLSRFNGADLDDWPALIINASGHLAYANQKAFVRALSIPHNQGVLIEPDQYGKFLAVAFVESWPRRHLIAQGLVNVVNTWSSRGFTTVFDAGINKGEPKILALLSSRGPVSIFGAAADLKQCAAEDIVGKGNMPEGGTIVDGLPIKTIKLWMDGSTQGFTAALCNDYLPNVFPSYLTQRNGWSRWQIKHSGITPVIDAPIYDEMLLWAERGYQLMVHSNGDLATKTVLDAYEKLFQTENGKAIQARMNRIEHFTVTDQTQVTRAAALQLGVSHTIGHVKYWGATFNDNILGPDRASGIDPVNMDYNAPICYSFNSDSPVSQADALNFMATAMTRKEFDSNTVLGEDQTVGFEAALAGVTYNPARQILMIDTIGSLEVGKSADFVVFKADIGSVAGDDIRKLAVSETWAKGIQTYAASK